METNGNGGARERMLALRREKIQTSIGVEHTVRGLSFAELSELYGNLLDVSTLLDVVNKAKAKGGGFSLEAKDIAAMSKMEPVIVAGCLEPKYGSDPAADLVVADLPPIDRLAVFAAICKKSGFSKEAAEQIRP